MQTYTVRVHDNGDTFWYNKEGKLHREDGPAVEYASGSKSWYQHGKHHRTDGPAIEYADGYKSWFFEGKLHRTDGPAIEWADGSKEWYFEGKLHRTDGPAIEYADGSKYWWINGKQLTEQEFIARTQPNSCHGKTVEIDGKQYKLVLVEE